MNAIDRYQQTQQECRNFDRWKSLIGKEYFGGTCRKGGQYGSVINAAFSCEIYHQESDGAINYHESNKLGDIAKEAFKEAAKKHAATIIATAFDLMLNRLAKDATAARALADSILVDSGKESE